MTQIKLTNAQIAWRAAQDLLEGSYVNLGIGFPEMIAGFLQPDCGIICHSENGILDFGGSPPLGHEDWDLINAGKKAITLNAGGSFFDHADSFAMVRGGHLDVAVLGAFEVAETGDLANWSTGQGGVPSVGGAMDLVHGAKQVWVVTDHVTKHGAPKLVERCSLPLTGMGCVTRIYTSLAVIDVASEGFVLREKIDAVSFEELQEATGGKLHSRGEVGRLIVPAV